MFLAGEIRLFLMESAIHLLQETDEFDSSAPSNFLSSASRELIVRSQNFLIGASESVIQENRYIEVHLDPVQEVL